MRVTKSLYGKVILIKLYCKKCKGNYIVIDDRFQCCGRKVKEEPTKEIIKREVSGENKRTFLSIKLKRGILANQNGKCIYCEIDLKDSYYYNKNKSRINKIKIHYDHFISWNYSRDNDKTNIVASCNICNILKSDLFFQNIEIAKEYLNKERERRNYNERVFTL